MQREKPQTNVTSFQSLHIPFCFLSQADVDVALSVFWCEDFSFGINVFFTGAIQILSCCLLHNVLE